LPLATAPVGNFFFFYPKDARQDSPGGAKKPSQKKRNQMANTGKNTTIFNHENKD